MVALQKNNKWIYKLVLIIGSTIICKTHAIKFVVFSTLIIFFWAFLKGKKKYTKIVSHILWIDILYDKTHFTCNYIVLSGFKNNVKYFEEV